MDYYSFFKIEYMRVINQKKKKIDDKSKEFAATENNFGGRGGFISIFKGC